MRIAALIVARNEEKVIQDSVSRVVNALLDGDGLFVVADNCTDSTAEIAVKFGAEVFPRRAAVSNTKGEALAWFIQEQAASLREYDYLLVLDADSIIEDDFFERLREEIPKGCLAGQCLIKPLVPRDSPIGGTAALSYFLEQRISDQLREWLGCSIRLRGTGMLIQPGIIYGFASEYDVAVEDIALSLLIAAGGGRIHRLEGAVVLDPIPNSARAASRQRARWFRGQWIAIRIYWRELIRVIAKGPCGWLLVGSLFFKPRVVFISGSAILAALLSGWPWISSLFLIPPALGLVYLIAGFFLYPNRREYLKYLSQLPRYAVMWLRSIYLSWSSEEWFNARDE